MINSVNYFFFVELAADFNLRGRGETTVCRHDFYRGFAADHFSDFDASLGDVGCPDKIRNAFFETLGFDMFFIFAGSVFVQNHRIDSFKRGFGFVGYGISRQVLNENIFFNFLTQSGMFLCIEELFEFAHMRVNN